jgi:pyrroline-5-carboxylate reductase
MEGRMLSGRRIGFLGAGNMAEALIRGLLASHLVDAGSILVSDVRAERLQYFRERYSLKSFEDNCSLVAACDILLLAVKPQNMREVLREIKGALRSDQTLISIAAGTPTALIIEELQREARVVRVMPNTPALVLVGASALCLSPHATPEDLEVAKSIFSSVGKVAVVEEALMDAVTAVSGSGPAYVFLAMEALREAGMHLGLPAEVAQLLVVQTFLGAARMVDLTGEDPRTLRERVSSPGGTTLAGLKVLEERDFRGILQEAAEAAAHRSQELAR